LIWGLFNLFFFQGKRKRERDWQREGGGPPPPKKNYIFSENHEKVFLAGGIFQGRFHGPSRAGGKRLKISPNLPPGIFFLENWKKPPPPPVLKKIFLGPPVDFSKPENFKRPALLGPCLGGRFFFWGPQRVRPTGGEKKNPRGGGPPWGGFGGNRKISGPFLGGLPKFSPNPFPLGEAQFFREPHRFFCAFGKGQGNCRGESGSPTSKGGGRAGPLGGPPV